MSDFLASRGIEVCSGFRPENLPEEDVLIVVLSNGAFDGIHEKLLSGLA